MPNADPQFQWLAALPEGAMVTDHQGTVVAVNHQATELLRLDATGLTVTSIIRAPSFATAMRQLLASGTAEQVEIEFNGQPPRQVNAHLALAAPTRHVLVLMRDLTREQAIEKMRSDFVANASHEMRTPLASVIAAIETLQGPARNDTKARAAFLDSMLTQALRMKRLIDDLLTLSRIELNEHVRPRGHVSLLSLARQARNHLASTAQELAVEVHIDETSDASVIGEADELLQVVLNLLENALKYGGTGGKVELRCYSSKAHGLLAVKDHGPGIAEVHLPRLTERFYRVSTKESRARGGTGLGLAIVKHILLRHHGELAVDSALGRGSTFTVSIPLAKST